MSPTSSPSDARRHFVIVGAQRCGTTYLYRLLDEHPDIELARPVRPEPKFFLDAERVAGGYAAYEQLFGHRPSARVRGEKGTTYIESEDVARRIMRMLPDARIVVLVRDPVARALSNYRFSVDNGIEALPVTEALTEEAEGRAYDRARISTSPFGYLRRGRYIDFIEVYLRHVPRDRLRVVVFEELLADDDVLADLCRFVGVEPFRPAGRAEKVNASEASSEALPPEQEARLRALFASSVDRLEGFLGRRIEAWPRARG